jgi:PDDEXK-like domain of unknown function (DUF3799)
MTRQDYFNSPYISQSFLKAVLKGPATIWSFLNRKETDSDLKTDDSSEIGNAVDCLLTTQNDFYNEFIICNVKAPGDDIIKVLKNYKKQTQGAPLGSNVELLNEISLLKEYGKDNDKQYDGRTKDIVKRLANLFNPETEAYYEFLLKSEGKTVLDSERMAVINKCVENIKHSYTKPFWDLRHDDRFEFKTQVVLLDHKNQRKGLLDFLIVNKTNKDIKLSNDYIFKAGTTLILDLKTGMYGPDKLMEYIYFWNIHIQLAWYKNLYKFLNPKAIMAQPVILYAQNNAKSTYSSWYELTQSEIDEGVKLYKEALRLWNLYEEQKQHNIHADVFAHNGKVKNKE